MRNYAYEFKNNLVYTKKYIKTKIKSLVKRSLQTFTARQCLRKVPNVFVVLLF